MRFWVAVGFGGSGSRLTITATISENTRAPTQNLARNSLARYRAHLKTPHWGDGVSTIRTIRDL
jgi:hypothetical protein